MIHQLFPVVYDTKHMVSELSKVGIHLSEPVHEKTNNLGL